MGGDLGEWIKVGVAIMGFAVGYGMLKASVTNLKRSFYNEKRSTHERFLRVESDVEKATRTLEGLKVGVENIDRRTDRMDAKIDKLLERS